MESDMSLDGHNELDIGVESEYGREYAIKVLSKGNLDNETLGSLTFEATRIHQSLPQHSNIVTLHRTLDTPAYLLLLLEFVPGEDLFCFIEQERDHYEAALASSLLGTLASEPLLGRTRLQLVASMFGQMCDAVAACHARGVFHRDIKLETFVVTDGWHDIVGRDGVVRRERRVVVKLTDFELSTTDVHSGDMECGSKPYMSYECQNNIHPTYTPRAADVWSLGITLINMLYYYNPWTDTTEGVCSSFTMYRQNPVHFFMSRFPGMTPAVAEFLATRVFCILCDPADDAARVSPAVFGAWARALPDLLAPPSLMSPTCPPGSAGHTHMSSVTVEACTDVQGHSSNPSLLAAQHTSWVSLAPVPEDAEHVHVTSWTLAQREGEPPVSVPSTVPVSDRVPASGLAPVSPPTPTSTPAPTPTVTKKPSKWRLGFGKSNSRSSSPVPVKDVSILSMFSVLAMTRWQTRKGSQRVKR